MDNGTYNIDNYEQRAIRELEDWQDAMQSPPSMLGETAKNLQTRVNRIIPDKVHNAITSAIKQMTNTVISGAGITTSVTKPDDSLEAIESKIRERISFYRSSAAVEGAATGYGGFIWGLADLPLWFSIKMKMLFEIASYYGFDIQDYKERVYILHIFQVTFSSQKHRNKIYKIMWDWENQRELLPEDINKLDWRSYWEEYRDHLDLAKLLQLIPGFGAVVGTYVNYRLTDKLGTYAMNAYRMRLKLER